MQATVPMCTVPSKHYKCNPKVPSALEVSCTATMVTKITFEINIYLYEFNFELDIISWNKLYYLLVINLSLYIIIYITLSVILSCIY